MVLEPSGDGTAAANGTTDAGSVPTAGVAAPLALLPGICDGETAIASSAAGQRAALHSAAVPLPTPRRNGVRTRTTTSPSDKPAWVRRAAVLPARLGGVRRGEKLETMDRHDYNTEQV